MVSAMGIEITDEKINRFNDLSYSPNSLIKNLYKRECLNNNSMIIWSHVFL